ncbi:MAG: hypothetical protein HWD59_10650 [Coxiellaceae bacterium]|nr:MAG: hypothetical protein HWD59_10650 [Coxiellaceae bacterium]
MLDAYQHSLGLILAKNTHLPILSVNTPTASYYQYNLPVLTRNQNAKLYQYGLVGYYDLGYNSANCTLEYHGPLDTEFALKDLRREVIAILTPDGQLIRTSEDYEVKVIQKRLHEEEIKKQEMLRQAKENELLDQYRTLVNQGNFAEAYPVERHILANGLSSANTIANILIVQMEYQLATGNKNNINYYANHFESLPDASDSYEINYAKGLYLTNELGAEPGSIAIATANNFLRKAKALNPQCIKCEEYIAYNKSKLPQDNVGLYALGATVLSGIFGIGWLWKKIILLQSQPE